MVSLILGRKSVAPRRLGPPGPSRAEVETLIACAGTAPDHGAIRPWRVLRIPEAHRGALAEAYVAAKLELEPEASEVAIDRARRKAFKEPETLIILFRPDRTHPVVPVQEQAMCVGAVIAHILLAAEAMGYGGMLVSGPEVTTRALRAALHVGEDEEIAGILALGTVHNPPGEKDRPAVADMLADWQP